MQLSIFVYLYLLMLGRQQATNSQTAYLGPHAQNGSEEYLKTEIVDPNEINFCLDIVSATGNMCNLSGVAKRTGGATDRIYVYRSGSEANECLLELQRTSTAWIVRDKANCAQRYCGAGLGIGKISFPLRQKTKVRRCIGEQE